MITTVILTVVLLDILTKYLVVQLLVPLGESVTLIKGVVDLTFVKNEGAAFGILSDARWVFMSVSVVFIVFLFFVIKKSGIDHPLFLISLSLVLGGGIGNMIDRVFVGYVVDFIELTFVRFAVFNVADSAITLGAVGAVVYFIFFDPTICPFAKKKEEKKTDGQEH